MLGFFSTATANEKYVAGHLCIPMRLWDLFTAQMSRRKAFLVVKAFQNKAHMFWDAIDEGDTPIDPETIPHSKRLNPYSEQSLAKKPKHTHTPTPPKKRTRPASSQEDSEHTAEQKQKKRVKLCTPKRPIRNIDDEESDPTPPPKRQTKP